MDIFNNKHRGAAVQRAIIMKVIPKEQRMKAYEYALANLNIGMCIMLAESVYGSFLSAPWTFWHECKKYFPELKDIKMPVKRSTFTPDQRKQILTKAIEQCTTPSPSR